MVRKVGICRMDVLLLIVGTMMITACSSLLYLPRVPNKKFYDPSKVGLQQEEVYFQTADGIRLHGWWFSAKTQKSKGTVIFFHGNAENISTHFLSLAWLPENGYNYFIFDYPGYGFSEGEPSPFAMVQSGHAALDWVYKHKDQRPLIIYAQSLGGNIGFRSVLDKKDNILLKALILDSTFLSYRSIARHKASESWLLWLFQPIAWLAMNDAYAPKNIEKRAPVPLLVIHGQADVVIPAKFGDEIFEKSPEPKEIWRIQNGQHGDTFWAHQREYRQKLIDYLDKL